MKTFNLIQVLVHAQNLDTWHKFKTTLTRGVTVTQSLTYAGEVMNKKYKRSDVLLACKELYHIRELANMAMDKGEDEFEYGGNVYTFSDRAGSVSDVDMKKKSDREGV